MVKAEETILEVSRGVLQRVSPSFFGKDQLLLQVSGGTFVSVQIRSSDAVTVRTDMVPYHPSSFDLFAGDAVEAGQTDRPNRKFRRTRHRRSFVAATK